MKGLSPEETRDLIVSVGTHKSERRLAPIQVSISLKKLIEAGESISSIKEQIRLSKSVVRSFLSLLTLPKNIQSFIGWGSGTTAIAFSSAIEISRLEKGEDKSLLAKEILENQLTLKDVTQVVQIHNRSAGDIQEAIKFVGELKSVVERRYLYIGEILSEQLLFDLEKISTKDKEALLSSVLLKIGLGIPTYGHAIKGKYFNLVGNQVFSARLSSLKNFEKLVTENLTESINRS